MPWLISPTPLPRRVGGASRGVETHKRLPPLPACLESSTEEVNQLAHIGTYGRRNQPFSAVDSWTQRCMGGWNSTRGHVGTVHRF